MSEPEIGREIVITRPAIILLSTALFVMFLIAIIQAAVREEIRKAPRRMLVVYSNEQGAPPDETPPIDATAEAD